jgi:predicted transcriptional regulator
MVIVYYILIGYNSLIGLINKQKGVTKMDKFSAVVIYQLEKQNISIPEFAKKISLSATYTYNLLNGKKRWNAETMTRACEVLSLDVEFNEKKGA